MNPLLRSVVSLTLVLGALVTPASALAASACPGPSSSLGNQFVQSVAPLVQNAASFPLDSVPSADASVVYFTATGLGVFQVPAAGGSAVAVATGSPFVAPTGIELSSVNQTIYVADPKAMAASGIGQIFAVPVAGGAPRAIDGASGSAPRGLAVAVEGGQDVLYYTGRDPANGQPGVFRLPAAPNSVPTVVVEGAPLVQPDGLTVSRSGAIYLTDDAAAGAPCGKVFQISGGVATTVVDAARLGAPAGIALSLDEKLLLVSAERPNAGGSDEVLIVQLASLSQTTATKVISQNKSNAGGLHRARGSDVFSWANVGRQTGVATAASDASANPQGQVYLVTIR